VSFISVGHALALERAAFILVGGCSFDSSAGVSFFHGVGVWDSQVWGLTLHLACFGAEAGFWYVPVVVALAGESVTTD